MPARRLEVLSREIFRVLNSSEKFFGGKTRCYLLFQISLFPDLPPPKKKKKPQEFLGVALEEANSLPLLDV